MRAGHDGRLETDAEGVTPPGELTPPLAFSRQAFVL
jgi:hypothetical protein